MVRIDQLHDDSVELPIWPTSTSRCLSTSTVSGSWNDKYMFQLGSARHFADYFSAPAAIKSVTCGSTLWPSVDTRA
jgi:hypothetical protein